MLKLVMLSTLLSLTATSLTGANPPAASRQVFPLEVELISALNPTNKKIGDSVLVKLSQPWSDGSCKLARGSALTGHITAVDPWSVTSKRTSISLLFDRACPEAPSEALTWIALLAPDNSGLAGLKDNNPVAVQAFRSSSFGLSGAIGSAGNTQGNHVDMSGRQNPNLPLFTNPPLDRSHPRPSAVTTGQVWHLPHLTLEVAAGVMGSSTLSSPSKSINVPRGAVLVLQPFSASVANAVSLSPPLPTSQAIHPQPIRDDADPCKPPSCTIASAVAWNPSSPPAPIQSISLDDLGYNRLKSTELHDLEYGAALAYLGSSQLLFTFNPHTLVTRAPGDDLTSYPHMVRVAVIDLNKSSVQSVTEWRVGDAKQYIWPLPGDQVLVHRGRDLVLLGAGFKVLATLHLPGPLTFVQHSPDGKHLAVGIVHELHTPKVHQALAEADSRNPEEEVSVLLLDQTLQTLSETRQSSLAMPLILSNQGRIALLHSGGEHWRYQLSSWTGELSTVARLGSACIPKTTSLTANLLYVQGCDLKTLDRWYRVLRLDGSSVLKGALHLDDMEPLPLGNDSGDAFALSLPKAHDGYSPGFPFHGTDLDSEAVRVYRASDGHRTLFVQTHAPAPTRQPVAFAPDGASIAVLEGEKISIYALTRNASDEDRLDEAVNPIKPDH